MKRLRRWLFNLLAGLSLLLCIATAVLTVRSHWICEGFGWKDPAWYAVRRYDGISIHHYSILSGHGLLAFVRDNLSDHPDGWERRDPAQSGYVMDIDCAATALNYDDSWEPHGTIFNVLKSIDIRCGDAVMGSLPVVDDVLILPDWLLVALFAVLPLWFLTRLIRRKNLSAGRKRLGLCINCGYDLRATPNRCPECGTVPKEEGNPIGKIASHL